MRELTASELLRVFHNDGERFRAVLSLRHVTARLLQPVREDLANDVRILSEQDAQLLRAYRAA